jgi:simple sugar transport system ATP-binding protein
MDSLQPAAETRYAVQMQGITKRFPGVLANEDVDLDLYRGEVLALLGENGAGKSTLMNVLAGLYQPEEGQVLIDGQPVHFRSPRDAIEHGIGMVHQHFMLVDTVTVAENVILGLHDEGRVLHLDRVGQKLEALSERYGLQVDPSAYIWQLSVGEQQRVEILKLLYRGAEVLILDEPTAVLTPQEAEDMATTLRQMVEEGKSIIFITHKLDEVVSFADRVMVLRSGRVVATQPIEGATKEDLARLMVGREVVFFLDKEASSPGPAALEVEDLEALNDKGLPALQGVTLNIREGEILGIAGVAGNGQRELSEVIAGMRPATGGRVRVQRQDITGCSPLEVIQAGVSHIPGDRLGVGLAPNLPVSDNLGLKAYRESPLARGPLLDGSALRRFAERLIDTFNIATPGPDTEARLLSGGNQQKAIVAREFSRPIRLLIAAQPTRGVDVGSIEYIHQHLIEKRDEGVAVLLISVELDEIMALSDRIAVMSEGQIVGMVDADQATREELGLLMAGERKEAAPHSKAGAPDKAGGRPDNGTESAKEHTP